MTAEFFTTDTGLDFPKLSIGMPVYNGEKYIKLAIESLINQTFRNFELIISDNASTDQTQAICNEFVLIDSRIKYLRHKTNIGAVANFEYVFNQSNGPFFMWAAADDVWSKDWIKSLYPLSVKEHCLAYGQVQTIDDGGLQTRNPVNKRKLQYHGSPFIRRFKYFVESDFYGKANPIYGIFPKSCIDQNFFELLGLNVYGTDMLFLYHLLSRVSIRSTNTATLFKRIHSNNAGDYKEKNKRIAAFKPFNILARVFYRPIAELKVYRNVSSKLEISCYIFLLPLIIALRICNVFTYFTRLYVFQSKTA